MPDPCYIALTGIPQFNRETTVGSTRRIEIDVTTLEGELADPEKLAVKIRNGEEEETTVLEYPKDAALVRTAEGSYYVDLELDHPGQWAFRVEANGEDLEGAAERTFYVSASVFDEV